MPRPTWKKRQEFFPDFAQQDQYDFLDELNDLIEEEQQKEADAIM